VVFVFEQHVSKAMFGKIMERGNFLPAGVSALLLLITGFWMVIPVFGLVSAEKQTTARPIKDRFAAEVRFLKKHGALTYYLEAYQSETKKTRKYRDLINLYRSVQNGTNTL
jgi:hypothetical protein